MIANTLTTILLISAFGASRQRGSMSRDERADNEKRINELLSNPPRAWRKQLGIARQELDNLNLDAPSERPDANEIIETVLELTAGSNKPGSSQWAGPRGEEDVEVPLSVAREAMKGIELSARENYGGFKFIGLARAIQLATRPKIWRRSVKRMRGYFSRHQSDQGAKGFRDDERPSDGWLAWLNWGGDSARAWLSGRGDKNEAPAGYMTRSNLIGAQRLARVAREGLGDGEPPDWLEDRVTRAHQHLSDVASYVQGRGSRSEASRQIRKLRQAAQNRGAPEFQEWVKQRAGKEGVAPMDLWYDRWLEEHPPKIKRR